MKLYRTRKPLHNRHLTTMPFGMVKPVYVDFSLPGDIWKLKANCLIRAKPMLSPSLTEYDAYFRFFFVPLRLALEHCEEIITGSKEGKPIENELPKAVDFIRAIIGDADPEAVGTRVTVHRDSFIGSLGVRPTKYIGEYPVATILENYNFERDDPSMTAEYFFRAYCLIIWHYFRDENYQSFDGDFETFYKYMLSGYDSQTVGSNGWYLHGEAFKRLFYSNVDTANEESYGWEQHKLWWCNLSRDYFMDTLPWIMKGAQPTINSVMHADFSDALLTVEKPSPQYQYTIGFVDNKLGVGVSGPGEITGTATLYPSTPLKNVLNNNSIVGGGFTAQDVRDMFAETRVFERLARTGSRYVEYLTANFGVAPADDTLQRPLYLGGFKQPIVTTEVVQTGGESTDVGTLRGHGISSGGNSIRPYFAKEFGIIFGLMYIKPRTQYFYQFKRKYSYKSRFDFFNPSFQFLSEQQIRGLEFFIPKFQLRNGHASNHDLQPFTNRVIGYNRMYEELRTDTDLITGELTEDLAYWTSAVSMNANWNNIATPPLNGVNICIGSYVESLNRPWGVSAGGFRPFIVDFGISGSVFRPLVKNPVPGLVDHF